MELTCQMRELNLGPPLHTPKTQPDWQNTGLRGKSEMFRDPYTICNLTPSPGSPGGFLFRSGNRSMSSEMITRRCRKIIEELKNYAVSLQKENGPLGKKGRLITKYSMPILLQFVFAGFSSAVHRLTCPSFEIQTQIDYFHSARRLQYCAHGTRDLGNILQIHLASQRPIKYPHGGCISVLRIHYIACTILQASMRLLFLSPDVMLKLYCHL